LELQFTSSGPEPAWTANRYPFFDIEGNLPVVFEYLRRNETAGQPGQIEALPQTSLQVLGENQVASGRYRLGVTCTYFNQTTQYWDTEIDISAPAGGTDPSAMSWTVVNNGAGDDFSTGSEGSSNTWIIILVAGLVLAAAVFVLPRRAATRKNAHAKDS
jgi:hypothetical protein